MTAGKLFARLGAAAVGLFVVASCVTVPSLPPPEWSESPPPDTYNRLTFVSSADSRRSAAQEMAGAVTRRLELGSEVEDDAAALVEFRQRLAAAAAGELGANVNGFTVADRAVSREEGEATHWISATYDREEFEETELALAREVAGGNPGPPLLRRAARRIEAGEVVSAMRDYGLAVVETADTPYASEVRESTAQRTRNVVDRIEMVVERGGIRTRVGESFDEPLVVQVRDAAIGAGIAGMPVLMTYREIPDDGAGSGSGAGGGRGGDGAAVATRSHETRRLYRQTEEDGRISFTPPAPRVRGSEQLEITLAPFFDLVTPGNEPAGLMQLVDIARDRSATLEYTAFSRAAQIPTGVFIVDTDIAGNPTGTMATQQGLLSGFTQNGFSTGALRFEPRRFLALGESDRISLIRQRFDGNYERAVLGTASITEFDEENSVSVVVGGELRVLELETGEELYRRTMTQRSRGNTASSAISAAFRSLGAKFAADLVRTLP
ncbi:MAG: hypothetical protein GVY14_12500 [Spirochaetes bacterium]|jgi:hypothetical protein|nr:hypothetical protein [Spirochaetota bacterium]